MDCEERAKSRWEAAFQRQKPLRISFKSDAAGEERPKKVPFARKKSQPRFRIGRDLDVWVAEQTMFDSYFSTADIHGRLGWLIASENEMVSDVELSGRVALK